MYFIDREQMEELLIFMESVDKDLKGFSSWSTSIEQRALERMAQLLVEVFVDVGNQVIDGFIMRDPGSYEDIVDILVDEQVLPEAQKEAYRQLVGLRKELVQNYTTVSMSHIKEVLTQYLSIWSGFPTRVRTYIESELGPVSAFKPTPSNKKEDNLK